jgi:beta-lactam-binding protein with PASTA domain
VEGPQKVLVPALVGLGVQDAHALARTAEVVVVSAEPDGDLPVTGTVSAQQPGAGTRVEPATPVAVLVEQDDPGGGRGVAAPPPEPLGPAGAAL